MYGPYYLLAGGIFTPRAMEDGRKILKKPKRKRRETRLPRRLEWLDKG